MLTGLTLGTPHDGVVNTPRPAGDPHVNHGRRTRAPATRAPPAVHIGYAGPLDRVRSVVRVTTSATLSRPTHSHPTQAARSAPEPTAPRVVCVIVTRDRPGTLRTCLAELASQSRPPDHVVVVDNGIRTGDDTPTTAPLVRDSGLDHTHLPSRTNLGGAGGFAYGILTARALGADWVWLADDDGRPANTRTLATLLRCAQAYALDAVSPLVLDIEDPQRLAFPIRRGLTWSRNRADLAGERLIPGVANLFNGALFSTRALDVVGVPDSRLFVRGDEVEVHRRLVRSGMRFGTCVLSTYLHPSGSSDEVAILGGRLPVYVPLDKERRDRAFRNLGYLTSRPGMRWRRWPDEARYAWYFLAEQRDPEGWRHWLARSREGRRERFVA